MRLTATLLYLFSILCVLPCNAQTFENASFSLRNEEGLPTSWKCVGGIFTIDTQFAKTEPGCLRIYNTGNIISTCTQTVPFKPGGMKKYRMKLFMRLETRTGFAEAWVTVSDAERRFISKEAMPEKTFVGKLPWKEYTIEFTTTADVANVEASLQLFGSGKVWFDDISIEEIPNSEVVAVPNKIAEEYLGGIKKIITEQCWYSDSVNLDEIYRHALPLAADATSTGDCYTALAYMLERLGDPLGQFYDPATTRNWWKEQKINDEQPLFPSVKMMEGDLAYIWLPGVTTMKKEILHQYADTMHKQLSALGKISIKGWILDLRENVGGNATAMLAAVGPLLNEGVQGKYIRSRETIDWTYKNGKANIDTTTIEISKPYKPRKTDLPVAVMTSSQTYGAGELIAVAFKGRKNCRSFGENTSGATYNEKRVTLPDKAMLFFTAGIMEDTKGQRYTGKIPADATIHMVYTEDACLLKAQKWLKEQN